MTREIVYRLLRGEQGRRLGQFAVLGGSTHRVIKAVERLRHDFARPLRIDEMAQDLGMSVSGFHHHFKAVTAMSPLQFQKHLRLQEARRLMLGEDFDSASAGYRVGTTTLPTSAASTSGSSARRRCATWSNCGKVSEKVPTYEPIEGHRERCASKRHIDHRGS